MATTMTPWTLKTYEVRGDRVVFVGQDSTEFALDRQTLQRNIAEPEMPTPNEPGETLLHGGDRWVSAWRADPDLPGKERLVWTLHVD